MTPYAFERVAVDDASLERCATLLNAAFPGARITAAMLRWQYRENPFGTIVGWNAIASDGSLAAHYVVQPLAGAIDGRPERGALSFNTATHPAHQGKGLFTELGGRTYASAADEGYGYVVGVANANSTPGFTRKLGFTLVRQLDARMGVGLRVRARGPAGFERTWSPQTARWRAANPVGRYRSVGDTLFAVAKQPLVRAVLATGEPFRSVADTPLGFRPLELWLGLEPARRPPGIEIPPRFRPSPLNFIFLDLSGRSRRLDPDFVRFRAIDFDPY